MGVPQIIIHIYRWIFHEINHPAMGASPFMEIPIWILHRILSGMHLQLSEPGLPLSESPFEGNPFDTALDPLI